MKYQCNLWWNKFTHRFPTGQISDFAKEKNVMEEYIIFCSTFHNEKIVSETDYKNMVRVFT